MEMIKNSSLVIFNRCDKVREKLGEFKRNIMLVNQKGYMVPGRQVMTCCEDDVTFVGYPCKYNKAEEYHSGDWVELTACFTMQKCFAYKGKGPVLEVEVIRTIDSPMKPIIGSR